MPRAEDWLSLWQGAPPPNWVAAVNRVMVVSLAMAIELDDKQVRAAYFDWLEDRVLKRIRSLDPQIYHAVMEQAKALIVAGADPNAQ
jgi:precorrin-4 methylase